MIVWNFAPRLSIKYKLLAGFLLVLILVAAFGVYAVGTLNTVDKSFNEVERQQKDLVKFAQLQHSHTALADSVKAFIITGDQKWERLYDDASIDFDKTVAELKALEEDPEETEAIADFEAINNRVKGTELLTLAKAREGEVARATELFDANYEGFQREASRILASLVESETQGIGEDIQEGKSLLISIKKVLVVLLVGLLVAVVAVSLFLAALITRPLEKLLRAAQIISQGDLSAKVQISSSDEIGRLATAFNEMADKLQESRAGLEQQVAERTQELSKTNRELEWEITEHKRVEQALRESEERYRRLVELCPDAIVVVSEGKIVFANPAEATLMGASSPEELIGKSEIELLHPEDRTTVEERLRRIDKEGEASHVHEGKIVRLDGEVRDIEAAGAAIIYQGKKAVQIIARDITGRKQAEEALRQSEERYRDLYENTPVMMHSIDSERRLASVNDYWLETLGYERSEVIGRRPTEFLTEASRRYAVEFAFPEFLKTGFASDVEHQMVKKNGEVIDVLMSAILQRDKSGEIEYSRAFIVDVTERRQAEDQIKVSLQEKEVLLKEINHRVKNNLQIISSLLNLQSRDIQDEQALRAFQVSQDRIRAMALVHEKLYQSEDLARIDFGEYIKSLATDLGSSYGLGLRNIELKIDVENILLGVDTAIPCGVIVNELVANSLKHAFPGDRSGEIAISFREVDGQYTMTFKDDGVGFPEDLDISHPSSLGLTIVNALTGQLGGTIVLGCNGGSEISIAFPAK